MDIIFTYMMLFNGIFPSRRSNDNSGGGAYSPQQLFDAAEIQMAAIAVRRNAIYERIQAIKARHAALVQKTEQISKPNEPMMEEVCALEDEKESILLEIDGVENEVQALEDDRAVLQRILEARSALPS